jgi:1-acyl-sn-glycerol-3-phosphate acyltransferase
MEFRLPLFNRIARRLGMPIFRGLIYLLTRTTIEGLENVPPRGAYMIVANHLATVDPAMTILLWPHNPEGLAAANQIETFFPGFLMRLYGAVPVHRGEYDRAVLEKALSILRANCPVFIMPEGTRSRKPGMQQAKPGAAYIATKANVQIVPVGITGTEAVIDHWKRWRRPRLTMKIGQPFELPPPRSMSRDDRRHHLEECTTLIMNRIADLLPVEYRGVYA